MTHPGAGGALFRAQRSMGSDWEEGALDWSVLTPVAQGGMGRVVTGCSTHSHGGDLLQEAGKIIMSDACSNEVQ